jgi:predicted enzyme related to lactoylglutathione lyase
MTTSPVLELRVALTAEDYERLVRFYQEGLGLKPAEIWTSDQGQGILFEMGRATLEIIDPHHAAAVDQIEAGRRVSGQIRLAIQVPDLEKAVEAMVRQGATLVHEPVTTPWNHRNARLQSPDGLQITLFQDLNAQGI